MQPTTRIAIAFLLLFVLLFGAQALAQANAPAGGVASTGRIIGQTSFAYLGGLRTFGAAILWNRLDPIFDGYYGKFDSSYQTFLPTVHLVQVLDPQFQPPYYITSYWLLRTGRAKEGIALAELGLKNNPSSGLMRAGLDQVLLLSSKAKPTPRMIQLAREGVSANVTWASPDDQFEGYGIFRAVLDRAGDKRAGQAIDAVQKQMRRGVSVTSVNLDATATPVPGLK